MWRQSRLIAPDAAFVSVTHKFEPFCMTVQLPARKNAFVTDSMATKAPDNF